MSSTAESSSPASAGASISKNIVLATGGYDSTIRLYEAHTGNPLGVLQHFNAPINQLLLSPDGNNLFSMSYEQVRIYDMEASVLNKMASINSMGSSSNISSGTSAINNQQMFQPVFVLKTPFNYNVVQGDIDKAGKWLATCSESGQANIWDLNSKKPTNLAVSNAPHNVGFNTLKIHPNQTMVLIGDRDGYIHFWDLRNNSTFKSQLEKRTRDSVNCIDISYNGRNLAVAYDSGCLLKYSLTNLMKTGADEKIEESFSVVNHSRAALFCKFSDDGSLLASTSADKTVNVYRTSDNFKFAQISHIKQDWVWNCAYSQDSSYLITGSADGVTRLWSLNPINLLREFQGHNGAVTCLVLKE